MGTPRFITLARRISCAPPELLHVEDHLALVLGEDVEIDVAALSHVTGGHRADEPRAER
jgi:hypothetical protein